MARVYSRGVSERHTLSPNRVKISGAHPVLTYLCISVVTVVDFHTPTDEIQKTPSKEFLITLKS